ncbi:serine/threonine protein kinase, partial [Streptomyces sp. uw30]
MNAPGDLVDGRFELVERLGSGGMGTVWRAHDRVLDREVALKAVRSDADTVGVVRERVMREARALARLSHPHVVTIHQIVAAEPHPWLVMELVPGVSLQRRLDDGPLTPVEAARLGREVLAALRAAHAAGIQHRDVKPANILLRPDGGAVLTDFGIAALQGTTGLTATGELIGSPEYMAPERIRGHDADHPAADLWSLGVVLYVCVEGVSPLRRPTTLATLAAVLDEELPAPTRSGPLTPVLEALLVRDPAQRPDAARLDAMLAQVESGTAPHWAAQPTVAAATPSPPPTPTQLDT